MVLKGVNKHLPFREHIRHVFIDMNNNILMHKLFRPAQTQIMVIDRPKSNY